VSQMFTCGLSDLLLLAFGSLVIFVLREYILKVHILVSSEHKVEESRTNMTLDSKVCLKNINSLFKKAIDQYIYKTRYKYFRCHLALRKWCYTRLQHDFALDPIISPFDFHFRTYKRELAILTE
jgi:hypothetical protein